MVLVAGSIATRTQCLSSMLAADKTSTPLMAIFALSIAADLSLMSVNSVGVKCLWA